MAIILWVFFNTFLIITNLIFGCDNVHAWTYKQYLYNMALGSEVCIPSDIFRCLYHKVCHLHNFHMSRYKFYRKNHPDILQTKETSR